jgi:hypothetical protein
MQLQHSEYASLEGYELFRRAIEERDEQAWAESITRYRRMLIFWARRRIARTTIGECCDDIADYAFTRAWKALSPERFAGFSTLPALLGYLRVCVSTAVIDCARHEMISDRLFQVIEADNVATPEQIVLDQLDRGKLWQIANSVVQNEQERCILIESYAYALPPRAILERHPSLFDNATEIYIIKRNLLERLKNCPQMRRLYQERMAA